MYNMIYVVSADYFATNLENNILHKEVKDILELAKFVDINYQISLYEMIVTSVNGFVANATKVDAIVELNEFQKKQNRQTSKSLSSGDLVGFEFSSPTENENYVLFIFGMDIEEQVMSAKNLKAEINEYVVELLKTTFEEKKELELEVDRLRKIVKEHNIVKECNL